MDCIFCKIIEGSLPSTKIYEDDDVVAIKDINPVAETHVLVIPKKHYSNINELNDSELAGKLLLAVPKVAKILGVENAYRAVINTGKSVGQTVFHIHIHLLSGRKLSWP
ncbi:MAG TPA: histidine triad nucleotide-binding protein [Caldisericia bacterium]|nr:histidine triad nucleotide-binding protein [Caldisericia bacterium]HPF49519.1 histidine triad nucleotide-binding protein [Caldisericia bacterium]HPI84187.1 histidine triad nucleotide-binding protein [Caldisericia bacterium]HPQ93518.1 histidine triad nucleotide-binding protein [Caldisericia bacterium]HRV75476.1 histidine triad nucleotide-binding protein [Caldisericia bacterium]